MTSIRSIRVDPRIMFAGPIRVSTFIISAICLANLSGPLRCQTPTWSACTSGSILCATPSAGNVGIGTSAPETRLHVEGLTTLHFDDWGNDTLVFRGQKNTTYQWGEYAIRTAYVGLIFRNTQTGNTLLQLGGGGGASANSYLNPSGGNVGIGTTTPQSTLAVNGRITTKEIVVTSSGWPDYVFKPGYHLRPLNQVAAYIKEHHHLPEIPSEAEVKEKGVDLGEMQAKLLAKVEELTLHMIEADERNDRLEQINNRTEQQNRELRIRIGRLEVRQGREK
jgi:hypothetical protein